MEMDPDALWTGFVAVVKGAIQGTDTTVHSGLFIHNQSKSSDKVRSIFSKYSAEDRCLKPKNKADKRAP